MAAFEHRLNSCDLRAQFDEIASADPPAFPRRCCAQGVSAPMLPFAMVLDCILDQRDYAELEELERRLVPA